MSQPSSDRMDGDSESPTQDDRMDDFEVSATSAENSVPAPATNEPVEENRYSIEIPQLALMSSDSEGESDALGFESADSDTHFIGGNSPRGYESADSSHGSVNSLDLYSYSPLQNRTLGSSGDGGEEELDTEVNFDPSLAARHSYMGQGTDIAGGAYAPPGTKILLPYYPLRGQVVFPGSSLPLVIQTQSLSNVIRKRLTEHAETLSRCLAVLTVTSEMAVFPYGTTVEIRSTHEEEHGLGLVTRGRQRFRFLGIRWIVTDAGERLQFAEGTLLDDSVPDPIPPPFEKGIAWVPARIARQYDVKRLMLEAQALADEVLVVRSDRNGTWPMGGASGDSSDDDGDHDDYDSESGGDGGTGTGAGDRGVGTCDGSGGDNRAVGGSESDNDESRYTVGSGRTDNVVGDGVGGVTEGGGITGSDSAGNNNVSYEGIGAGSATRVRAGTGSASDDGFGADHGSRGVLAGSDDNASREGAGSGSEGRRGSGDDNASREGAGSGSAIRDGVEPGSESRRGGGGHDVSRDEVSRRVRCHGHAGSNSRMRRPSGRNKSTHINDPVMFSFWLASTLPISLSDEMSLFMSDTVVRRLQEEIKYLQLLRNAKSYLRCQRCHVTLGDTKDMFSMGSDGARGSYVNPSAGFVHEIITLRRLRQYSCFGAPSSEYSWFPGYAWTSLNCFQCHSHLGWRFDATDENLKPKHFFGIRKPSVQLWLT